MKTVKEIKAERRKIQRKEFKIIESHLHPAPEPINGLEVCHEHQVQHIIFTAWKNNKKFNNNSLKFHRSVILSDKHFYDHYQKEFNWLCN